ncbi:unnamed protein product [Clonostachys rosea f. rosea IK726]|nr:unnamed protein product [Clonostachys rosea f. rosea IK726]
MALSKLRQHSLSLADLVKHGRPPLSEKSLLSSANFTLSLLPIRLAHRLQALRNLPYIVVSNPNISQEIRFTNTLAELVAMHTDTIPILARGFLECRRYISPAQPDTTFASVPMHLEYIVTEMLKNAFRATIENRSREPVVVTIAPEPPQRLSQDAIPHITPPESNRGQFRAEAILPLDDNAPGVTIRIRDRGGGIPPQVVPDIWSYSFSTFSEDDEFPGSSGSDGLSAIANAGSGLSSIAGLGYGLPLSRAYAEYFGGGIAVQSLYRWGTDVYLRLKGIGQIDG